ncbi:MAG: LptF/LptG family permease, partial [Armatimonadota bacterium]
VAGQRDFMSDIPVMLGRYLVKVRVIQRMPTGDYSLQGVFLHEETNPGEHEFVIADSGTYKDGVWSFFGAKVYLVSGDKLLAIRSQDLTINQKIDLSEYFRSLPVPEEKSIEQLFHDIQEGKKIGRDTRLAEANFHEKIVMPLTCVVFAVMSAYVCVKAARFGAYTGTFLSFIFAWLFFNLHVVAKEIFAAHGWLPAWVALYVPLVTLCIISVFLVRGTE